MSTPFHAPIAQEIWDMKYRFKEADGTPIDQTLSDTWWRIANALAAVEKDERRSEWAADFYSALEDFKFLPAGRITAGAGTDRSVTLFNCYVMGTIPDSMEGIFENLKEASLTMQQGGGIGYDFSTIRPKGALVKGVAADASGPLTFMDCWDAMCRTVMSAGSRRGAMMATMRCDHPDIEDFITAKQDAARLRMFNMSVLVTDDFMDAVKNGERWALKHKEPCADCDFGEPDENGLYTHRYVMACDLWDQIMRSTYDYAEPGVIFIDKINNDNNLRAIETIAATNPCGEQPLPPYGACLLGSLNLTKFVVDPFGECPRIDSVELKRVVALAVRMMDNVNDVSNFPLEAQAKESAAKRRIGLGVTGLADMLVMCGLTYGTEEAGAFANQLMHDITTAAYETSVQLAKEKGAFPAFDAKEFLADGTFASRLPLQLRNRIKKHGIRNSHLTSIAPTGTISLYAGNVSSGIEPIFALSYDRKVLQPDGTKTTQTVEDYAVAAWTENGGLEELPHYFVTAQDLPPEAHLVMQAALQPWIDSSISKTINLPEDISFEDFKNVYQQAYDLGCKGCTTYRPNDVTGSVISVSDDTPPDEVTWDADGVAQRPDELLGSTYKIKYGGHAIYITMNDAVVGGQRRPFEIFVNSKNMEHYAWIVGLTRMISAVFRRGGDVQFVADELKNVFDPRGGEWVKGKYVPSVLAAIGQVVELHMQQIGYMEVGQLGVAPAGDTPVVESAPGEPCANCGSFNTKNENGCAACLDCGHSKCG